MTWPPLIARFADWLWARGSQLAYEPPPAVGRLDTHVVLILTPIAIFAALFFAAPFMVPPDSTGDLSGRVGTIDNAQVWGAFPEPAQWMYKVGDIACHTKAARSFVLNGNQLPMDARNTAIIAGAVAGLALCLSPKSRAYKIVAVLPWWSYFALLAPMALDGGAQDFLGFESTNLRRVLTGFPAGLAIAFAFVFIAYEGHFARDHARKLKAARRAKPAPALPQDIAAGAAADARLSNLRASEIQAPNRALAGPR